MGRDYGLPKTLLRERRLMTVPRFRLQKIRWFGPIKARRGYMDTWVKQEDGSLRLLRKLRFIIDRTTTGVNLVDKEAPPGEEILRLSTHLAARYIADQRVMDTPYVYEMVG